MIHLTRRAEQGDTVAFVVLHNLMPRDGVGEVLQTTPYGARVKVTQADPAHQLPETVDVPLCDAVVVLDENEVVKYLLEQLKLISIQDQAGGGTLSAAQQANGMRAIAVATLNKFKEIKK